MSTGDDYKNPILLQPARALPKWIGIVGAGTIGPDIGYFFKSAIADLKLVLVDIDEHALDSAVDRIHGYVQKGLDLGKLTAEQAHAVRSNIIPSVDYEALAYCDWVIEAATEDLEVKRQIFSQVESNVRGDALITSNTSSLPADRLFAHLRFPERCTVTHFFAPAFRNPIVEVTQWEEASKNTISYLLWLFYITDKVPLRTKNVVCFMLDRIFDNWCNEAGLLLNRATPAQIDYVAAEFVHAGPFFVLNLANGNPIIVETNSLQAQAEGDHYAPAQVFHTAGRWKTIRPGDTAEVPESAAQDIRDRLLGVLFSQTVDILDRGIGAAEDLELGCRLALGFKKGPLEIMRNLGAAEVQRIIEKFAAIKPGMPTPSRPIESYHRFKHHILIDRLHGVQVITLRRPEALNALHDTMTDEILEVITASEKDNETSGFVITGYGTKAFCAGADIGRFPSLLGSKERSAEYARACARLLTRLDRCPKPVVAAINGMALGGGLELAIRCHGIVATANASLQFPEITLGIVPGLGATVIPYRRWPAASATFHDMLTKAKKITALKAAEIGMVDTLVEKHSNLLPAAIWLVKVLAGNQHIIQEGPVKIAPLIGEVKEPVSAEGQRLSGRVIDIMRRAIIEGAQARSLDDALEIGYAAFGASACTAAANEGISAFTQRRKPDFDKTG